MHVDLTISGAYQETLTFNIIATTREGDAESSSTVGAHLDSVEKGPGINDNGSGSSSLLVLADALLAAIPHGSIVNQLRFCWWAAEERGLLGSKHYVADLVDNGEADDVALNLNFDMLGSPNGIRSAWCMYVYSACQYVSWHCM